MSEAKPKKSPPDNSLHLIARTRGYQGAFLAAYAKTCRIGAAADAAGISRQSHYDWLKADAEYPAMFAEARILADQVLEDAAIDRAVEGWDEPVFHEGKVCGAVRKRSDRLLELILRTRLRKIYGDRQSIELTGKDGVPLIPLEAFDAILRDDGAGT